MTTPNDPAAGRWVGPLPPIIDKTGYRPDGGLFDGLLDELVRSMFGIPDGFPLWYVPPQLALEVGPVGKLQLAIRALRAVFADAAKQITAAMETMRPALEQIAADVERQRKHTPPFWAIDPTRTKPPRR